jgi:hypothetical protein
VSIISFISCAPNTGEANIAANTKTIHTLFITSLTSGIKRTITSYNATTGVAVVTPGFSTQYASGTAYIIADERIATVTVSTFGSAPATDSAYTVLSAFIDTPNYFFKSRTTPTLLTESYAIDGVTLQQITTTLTSRGGQFVTTYTQAEGVGLKYYIYNLYNETGVLLDTSGQIFSEFLGYTYDGLVSGNNYDLDVIVVNQDDTEVSTGKQRFYVAYTSPALQIPPDVTNMRTLNGVEVDWISDKMSEGVADGTTTFIEDFPFAGTNSVDIQTGTVQYTKISGVDLNIDPSAYGIMSNINTKITNNGNLIRLYDAPADGGEGQLILKIEDFILYREIIDPYGHSGFPQPYQDVISTVTIPTDSLLTASGTPTTGTGYIWDDGMTWSDTDIWTETDPTDAIQLKVTMLPPDDILVKAVTA